MVKINEKEYEVSPLRCKHLRQITAMLDQSKDKAGLFVTIEKYMPFAVESIKVKNPTFTQEELDECTLSEFLAVWNEIVAVSGIKFIQGETKPTAESIGDSSTDASVAPSAGHTVM